MSILYFRLGDVEGLTANKVAERETGYAIPIRELLQNSMDACANSNQTPAEVEIYFDTIKTKDIPCIADYKKVLKMVIQTAEEKKSYESNQKQRVARLQKALESASSDVLFFCDNGTGMDSEGIDALISGRSQNKGARAGGSHGVGHLSAYWLSSLDYLLYATRYRSDGGEIKTLFTGSPILAGYHDGEAQRGPQGRLVEGIPDNERDPVYKYLSQVPPFLKDKMPKDTGTTVAVLSLEEKWNEDAEYAIASNFFHAIAHDHLVVTINKGGKAQKLDEARVNQLIADRQDRQTARNGAVLSGKAVWQCLQTIQEHSAQNKFSLSNGESVYVNIKQDDKMDSTVVLVRNGMLIARHDHMITKDFERLCKDDSYNAFTAVIDVDSAPCLYDLVKGAESRHHNQLEKKRLEDVRESELKSLLNEINEQIKGKLSAVSREGVDMPMFRVQQEGNEGKIGLVHARGDIAVPPKVQPPPPPPSEQTEEEEVVDEEEKPKRPTKKTFNRELKCRKAFRVENVNGGLLRVHIRLRVEEISNKEEAYLFVCLAADNDDERRSGDFLEFSSVVVDGKKINFKTDGETRATLGKLCPRQTYEVCAEMKSPANLGAKFALQPHFGVRQTKSQSNA